ncbi:hypothetical protein GCM10027429_22300 [Marivirga atlantica]|jgi:hypothetical protein|uniref:Uncharacterized protein n=1 Tax=Marivirga atlantica TaxID=1548457 RepID=A0A937AGK4_9BACT|nr:hypothetical protein [Marivirga atlantica]MBL0765848.1 hypothetical protein [Marivirga atlantica]
MSKLNDLIKSLKAYTIIIIEDEITYIDDPIKLLIEFCLSEDRVKKSIIEELDTLSFSSLGKAIIDFDEKFNPLLVNSEDVQNFLPGGHLARFLKKLGKEELLQNEVYDEFERLIEEDGETQSIKACFAKYGIYLSINETHYNELLTELKKIEEVEILYYKQTPGADKEPFYKDIQKSVKRTNSNFCLAIIDKSLSTGSANEVGKDFIIDDLVGEFKDNPELRFIACLYTSRPDSVEKELLEYEDFFIEEITKGSERVIEKMTKSLAQSAFAEVFNSIRNKKNVSTEEAFTLVLKNQKNIKHIIQESHSEGIPPYDAAKYWFELAERKKFDDHEVEDFKFIAGLSAFFRQNYLDDHPKTSEIGDELLKINTFEIFDYNVNKKYLPIAPGDIWQIDGSYYMILGQLCDTLLRKDNTRKAKLAELFKIELSQEIASEKYEVRLSGGNKFVFINNFFDISDNNYKTIQIEISTPNLFYADFSVLDLCMFNDEGNCIINPYEELENDIKLILPQNKDRYYQNLKIGYQKLAEINIDELLSSMAFNDPIDFPITKVKKVNDKFSYNIKRVCRLKGRYYDSLYNNYLNNKGRIDLNLIDNTPELIRKVTLRFKLPGDDDSTRELKNFDLWSAKGKEFFRLSDVQAALIDYQDLLSFNIEDKFSLDGITHYKLIKESHVEYHLNHKYRIDDGKYLQKTEFSFNDLFGEVKPNNNPNFQIIDSGEIKSFLNDQGYATKKLTIEELKMGVIIFDKSLKIQLIKGVLKKNKYEKPGI